MLPNKYRLKNKKAFDATYKQRNVVSNAFLILYAGRRKTDPSFDTKAGFVVSKKIHKRAVKRNRVKRLIRESCRLMIKEGTFCEDYQSLIFLPKHNALEADFKQIKGSVEQLINKLKQVK